MTESETLKINQKSLSMKRNGKKTFLFGFGQSPFPVPDCVVASLVEHAREKAYLPTEGLKELREVIAEDVSKGLPRKFSSENVVIGPGSKELLFLLQLVLPEDWVVYLPTPSWVSYLPQAMLVNRACYHVPHAEGVFKLEAEYLEAFLKGNGGKKGLLVLTYPNNPTGLTYSRQELVDISAVAKKYGIIIVADEIYHKLTFSPDQNLYSQISEFYPEGTIMSSGLSKWAGAGGWRLGHFVIPDELNDIRTAMIIAASETYTSASSPIQYAAVEAYRGNPEIDNYLVQSKSILKSVATEVVDLFHQNGIDTPISEGGFYTYPNFENYRANLQRRGITTNTDLVASLLDETGVALLPGSAFGEHPNTLTARLAFVDFDGKKAFESSDIKPITANVSAGVQTMISWLKKN